MKTMSMPVVIAVIMISLTAAAAILYLVLRRQRVNRLIAQENSYLRAMNRAFMTRYTRVEPEEDGEVRLKFADGASVPTSFDEISNLTAKVKASISKMMSPDGLVVTNSSIPHTTAGKSEHVIGEVVTMKRDDNDREYSRGASCGDGFDTQIAEDFEDDPRHMFSRNVFKFRVLRGGAGKDDGEDRRADESRNDGEERANSSGDAKNADGVSYREEGLRRGLRILPSPVDDKPGCGILGRSDAKHGADLIMRRKQRDTDDVWNETAGNADRRPGGINRDDRTDCANSPDYPNYRRDGSDNGTGRADISEKCRSITSENETTEHFDSINRKISGIAILDVQHEVLGSIERVLTDGGYSTRAYEDPVDALKALISEPCNILIVSSRMRSVSGMEFAEYVRQVGGASRIVMMTDYADHEAQTLLHRGLINGYLTKPISPGELMDKVSAMMDGISGER